MAQPATALLEPESFALGSPRAACLVDWCVATHVEDSTFHEQVDTPLPIARGRRLLASIWFDARARTAGIYLGDDEMTAEQARTVSRKLAELADLADATIQNAEV